MQLEASSWRTHHFLSQLCSLILQGIAFMESKQGNYKAAQQLFQQGIDRCAPHAPLFNAWASMEVSLQLCCFPTFPNASLVHGRAPKPGELC